MTGERILVVEDNAMNMKLFRDLLEAKRFLAQRLPHVLPSEVTCNELLMSFCRGLVAPDPMRRFPSAEAADLVKEGAASFHRPGYRARHTCRRSQRLTLTGCRSRFP